MKDEINLKESLKTFKICILGGLFFYFFCYMSNGTIVHYLLLTVVYMFFMLLIIYSNICSVSEEIEKLKERK